MLQGRDRGADDLRLSHRGIPTLRGWEEEGEPAKTEKRPPMTEGKFLKVVSRSQVTRLTSDSSLWSEGIINSITSKNTSCGYLEYKAREGREFI